MAIITGGGAARKDNRKTFRARGAKVFIVDLNKEILVKASYELDHENLSFFVDDISKANDTNKYVVHTLEVHGKTNIFFSNAGIEGTTKPIAEYPDEVLIRSYR